MRKVADVALALFLILVAIGFADTSTGDRSSPAWYGAASVVLLVLGMVIAGVRPIARLSARPEMGWRALASAPPQRKPEKRTADRTVLLIAGLLSMLVLVNFGPWPGRVVDVDSLMTALIIVWAPVGWYWVYRDRIVEKDGS